MESTCNLNTQSIKLKNEKKTIAQVELGRIQFNQLLLSNELLLRILNQVYCL